MPFHGKCREDFVIWRTTYSGIQPDQFDLANPDHEEKLGYGRAIMFFTCQVRTSLRLPMEIKHLVFMEEVWRYTAPKPDYLADEYKCHHLYSTQVRDPPLSTTWWTLTIYWDQQLYSDAQ